MWNTQTWQLAVGHYPETRDRLRHVAEDVILDQAIENLRGFAVVGISERMRKFALEINQRFGFKIDCDAPRFTLRFQAPQQSNVDPTIRRKIAARTQLDIRLYEHVVHRYVGREADLICSE